MQTLFKSVTKFVLLSGMALLVFNCSKDEANPLEDNQQIDSTELKTILETDDISGAADNVIAGIFNGGTSKSSRLEDCHVTEFTDTGFNVTFESCTYEGSAPITGSISIAYTVGQESSFMATYTNLMVGDYEINGTRGFTIGGDGQSGLH